MEPPPDRARQGHREEVDSGRVVDEGRARRRREGPGQEIPHRIGSNDPGIVLGDAGFVQPEPARHREQLTEGDRAGGRREAGGVRRRKVLGHRCLERWDDAPPDGGAHQGREDALGDRANVVQAVAIVPVKVFLDHQGAVPDHQQALDPREGLGLRDRRPDFAGVETLGRWGGDRPLGGEIIDRPRARGRVGAGGRGPEEGRCDQEAGMSHRYPA